MRPRKSAAQVALIASVAIESIPFLGLLVCASQGWTVVNHPFSRAMAVANMPGVYVVYKLQFLLPEIFYAPKPIVCFATVFAVQVAVIWLVIMVVMMIIRKLRRY